jgi:hypothetical protein
MKNFVSFNIKTYSKSEAEDIINHSHSQKHRKKSTNILFPEYSKHNISSEDTLSKYNQLTAEIEEIKGKKIQKNANHYLEGVLSFSFDKFKDDPKEFKDKAPELIEKYMNDICKEYGFSPVGWSLHFDEGYMAEDGSKSLNIHAHVQMINYDLELKKARFREYQQKFVRKRKYPNPHFVKMQDMADKVFEPLGFVRGVSKEKTLKAHNDKENHVIEKLSAREKKFDELNLLISKKEHVIVDLDSEIASKEDYHSNLVDRVADLKDKEKTYITAFKDTFNNFKTKLSILLKSLLESDSAGSYNEINDVQSVINKSYDDFDDQTVGDHLTDSANEAVKRDLNKPFKKKKPKL